MRRHEEDIAKQKHQLEMKNEVRSDSTCTSDGRGVYMYFDSVHSFPRSAAVLGEGVY